MTIYNHNKTTDNHDIHFSHTNVTNIPPDVQQKTLTAYEIIGGIVDCEAGSMLNPNPGEEGGFAGDDVFLQFPTADDIIHKIGQDVKVGTSFDLHIINRSTTGHSIFLQSNNGIYMNDDPLNISIVANFVLSLKAIVVDIDNPTVNVYNFGHSSR